MASRTAPMFCDDVDALSLLPVGVEDRIGVLMLSLGRSDVWCALLRFTLACTPDITFEKSALAECLSALLDVEVVLCASSFVPAVDTDDGNGAGS